MTQETSGHNATNHVINISLMTKKAVVEWQQLPIACCSEWYQQVAMHGSSHGNGPFCITQNFFYVTDIPDDTTGPYPDLTSLVLTT